MMLTRPCGPAMLLAGAAMLHACAPVPQLGDAPAIRSVSALDADHAASMSDASLRLESARHDDWWSVYGDAQLSRLMAEALGGSPDLEAAAARLRTAQGYAQQAGSALLPSVDGTASAGFVQQSESNGVPAALVPDGWERTAKLGLGFSFDPDIWGKTRASLAAAKLDAEAAAYGYAQARLALTTSIASTYAELARLYAQRDVIEATIANRDATLALVAQREAAGLDNRAALAQAKSRVPFARADLAATDEAIAQTRNALAALVGAGPSRAATITRPATTFASSARMAQDAVLELVGRRPDIAAARASAEAAASRIKVARADFYPNISLSGLIGLQALGFSNLFKGSSAYGSVGPAITLPIFHGGALQGQYRSARGQYDEAVAKYDGTVVQALREVADALVSTRMLEERLAHSRAALGHSEEAYELARKRYASGLSTYLDVLSAEEGVLQARQSVADLETRAFTVEIAMVRALGGGFATT